MTPVHRPLSAWIAHVSPNTGEVGLVNDGDDRADAREMDYFAQGWHRAAVPWGEDLYALGLVRGDDTTVVELDDFGAPIVASTSAAAIVDQVERRWPVVDGTTAEMITHLDLEALPLRYWLLERLSVEGEPPDEVFSILPWDMLDRAAEAAGAGLDPGGRVGDLVEIRHWLTPAVRGLTGPLEQLDYGLRTGNPDIARLGATALLTSMLNVPVSRIPERSRVRLSRLAAALGRIDPLYRHTSRIAVALLTDQSPVPRLRTELHSSFEAAAATENRREHIEILGDKPHQVRLVETRAGRLRLTARVPKPPTLTGPLAERVGAFLPVRLARRDGGQELRLWIALSAEADHLVGAVTVTLSRGRSELDADDAPIGAQDLSSTDANLLLASLQASTATTAQRWLDISRGLPHDHPVRVAANAFEESL